MRHKLRQKMKDCMVFSWRDLAVTIVILLCAMILCVVLRQMDDRGNFASMIFVMAVMVVSRLTTGYLFGVAASFIGVIGVNYAFTYPYLALNFTLAGYPITFMTMLLVSISTCALTNQLRGQERLRAESEKEKMRANLLRAISHDLRTPLTTIYGSSAALRENADVLTQEQKDKMLLGIQEDAQWLVRMVENLLSITRMDSGNLQIATVTAAVDELIDSVLLKFRKRYPDQPVQLELPEDLVLISMDCMLMEQVLINLLENAVQHATGLTRIILRVTTGNGKALFEVQDDGCGIPPERMSQLFTGYFPTGEKPVDNAKRNAGIGLSLCATIVRAHGGTMEAENLPTGGAAFRFALDMEETADEQ